MVTQSAGHLGTTDQRRNMSKWDSEGMAEKVVEALSDTRLANPTGHHFGRPFVTAYQLAIEIERRHPGTAAALGKGLGGC
jgi:hypothetical protein